MGLLDTVMAADMAGVLDTDEFGESITYTPTSGSAVAITAIVDRAPPEAVNEFGEILAGVMRVQIANVATTGVTSVDTGGDTITVAYRKGGTAAAYRVVKVIAQDSASWLLLVR